MTPFVSFSRFSIMGFYSVQVPARAARLDYRIYHINFSFFFLLIKSARHQQPLIFLFQLFLGHMHNKRKHFVYLGYYRIMLDRVGPFSINILLSLFPPFLLFDIGRHCIFYWKLDDIHIRK
jgi:hypothetical protein